jgi:hypothetical protein
MVFRNPPPTRSVIHWLCAATAVLTMLSCNLPLTQNPPSTQTSATQDPLALNPETQTVQAIASPTLASSPASPDESPESTQTSSPPDTSLPAPTDTAEPPTQDAFPCTVQTSLFFRSGPGKVYPQKGAYTAGTKVAPSGYYPLGFPGGPWALVSDASGNQGWVSAVDQFITCTVDISGLPQPAIPPTPTPQPQPTDTPTATPPTIPRPQVQSSTPFGDPNGLEGEPVFDNVYFVKMDVHDPAVGDQNGDGITKVDFQVQDLNGNTVYSRPENTASYCIFGGGEPNCNPWVIENGVAKWTAGGDTIESGDYKLNIFVTADNPDIPAAFWGVDIHIEIP